MPSAVSFLRRFLVLVSMAVLLSGAGHALANPGANRGTMGEAVHSLIEGHLATDDLPDDFASVMGYTPVEERGRLVRPDGTCSLPLRLHPDGFDTACRAHDLGYDLLRYGAATSHEVTPDLRHAIDDAFHRDLVSECPDRACLALAHTFWAAVTINSIRQGFGPPTTEPLLPWATVALATVVLAVRRR